jgi:hypothetical protein
MCARPNRWVVMKTRLGDRIRLVIYPTRGILYVALHRDRPRWMQRGCCVDGVGILRKTIGLPVEPDANRLRARLCTGGNEVDLSRGWIGVRGESVLEYLLCFKWDAAVVASARIVVVFPIQRSTIYPVRR